MIGLPTELHVGSFCMFCLIPFVKNIAAPSIHSPRPQIDGGVIGSSGNDLSPAFEVNSYGTVSTAHTPPAALASLTSSGLSTDPFQFVLDYYSAPIGLDVASLAAAGWVDDATVTSHIEVAFVNYDVGMWARALFTVQFSRGGSVFNTAELRSLPIDPYYGSPELALLDALLLLYGAQYAMSLLRTTARTLIRARKLTVHRGCSHGCAHMASIWFIVDWAAGLAIGEGVDWAAVGVYVDNRR